MDEDYKRGYADGRYGALDDLKRELSNKSEPLFQEILSGSSDKFVAGQLSLINELQSWLIDEQNK
ncbi:hypothetical protein EFJ78_01935 [Pediococcus pentosaceus]|uniref:hypothetical protein n=1 Tax=Pediococcus pentosaceus TaxID=1255 RepID=UPI00223C453A|nr:hypothetical protein [Pediococcus pentosaceus]MCS8562704.1 hypothetical protein [Pediococcus pentosaceus]MCS8566919.1 hypothetical protein [Pediococcus pentosaceus]MCS8579782.1 hypothetical protein [Pediococcus pentosaceus]